MLHLVPLLRPRQWVKNAFVAAPLFFGLELFDAASAAKIAIAVVMFCLLSSAAYIFNDLRDIESDRQHPKKRFRLLAAGGALQKEAAIMAMALIGAGVALGFIVKFPPVFYLYTAGYLVINIAYSLFLKRVNLVEMFIVASGYVLRVLAGCAVIGATPSPWILSATGILALLIVAGKRRSDPGQTSRYSVEYLDNVIAVLGAATIVTYLLFTASDYAIQRYGQLVIATSVFVVYGVLRYMQLIQSGRGADEPTTLVLSDAGIRACVVLWAAAFFALIYVR